MTEAAVIDQPTTAKRAVAKRETKAIAVQEPPTSFLEVIYRAAKDPTISVDKMERLMAMQEKMDARHAEMAFNDGLSDTQKAIRPIAADASNKQTNSRYATYAALDRIVRPIYSEHGFSLSFNTEAGAAEGHIRVVCHVSHSAGHTRKYQADLPADGKGAKGGDVMTKTHAAGSAMTYGQRYLLKLIFNIAIGDSTDDDGNAASGDPISEAQYAELQAMIVSAGADIQKFCTVFKIEMVQDLPAKRFGEAKLRLERYAAQQKAPAE